MCFFILCFVFSITNDKFYGRGGLGIGAFWQSGHFRPFGIEAAFSGFGRFYFSYRMKKHDDDNDLGISIWHMQNREK